MEFKKNRQEEILLSARNLAPPQGISIPAFLTSVEANNLEKRLEEAQRLLKNIKKHLPLILEDPETYDPVYQICQEVFSKKDHICYGQGHTAWNEIQGAAQSRYRLGYPPRKSSDTSIGDAVNWEWIVHCAKTLKSNIAIVSRDGDYGRFYEEDGFLNDHLKREFSDRVGKEPKISLYRKLTVVLKDFHITVTKKEQQEENRIIQSSERASENIGLIANNLSAKYSSYFNAISPLPIWELIVQENAKQKAMQQAVIAAAVKTLGGEEKDPS